MQQETLRKWYIGGCITVIMMFLIYQVSYVVWLGYFNATPSTVPQAYVQEIVTDSGVNCVVVTLNTSVALSCKW